MNDIENHLHDQLRKKISEQHLNILLEIVELTASMPREADLLLLQNLLLEELKKRNPNSYQKWIVALSQDQVVSPSDFFDKN